MFWTIILLQIVALIAMSQNDGNINYDYRY